MKAERSARAAWNLLVDLQIADQHVRSAYLMISLAAQAHEPSLIASITTDERIGAYLAYVSLRRWRKIRPAVLELIAKHG